MDMRASWEVTVRHVYNVFKYLYFGNQSQQKLPVPCMNFGPILASGWGGGGYHKIIISKNSLFVSVKKTNCE